MCSFAPFLMRDSNLAESFKVGPMHGAQRDASLQLQAMSVPLKRPNLVSCEGDASRKGLHMESHVEEVSSKMCDLVAVLVVEDTTEGLRPSPYIHSNFFSLMQTNHERLTIWHKGACFRIWTSSRDALQIQIKHS